MTVKAKGPCLPYFDDSKDDCDAYLRRFELFAKTARWPKESWGIILSSYLSGSALETYVGLKEEDAVKYDRVKRALMERYDCNSEGFRKRFRNARPLKGERVERFITRMRNALLRWIELSERDGTYESLLNLLISEQFLQVCGKTLQTYLCERFPLNLEKITELAEGYVTAHGGLYQNSKSQSEVTSVRPRELVPDTSEPVRRVNVPHKISGQCYVCAKTGHKAADCRMKRKPKQGSLCQETTNCDPVLNPKPRNPGTILYRHKLSDARTP